jgi:hypothetical protein
MNSFKPNLEDLQDIALRQATRGFSLLEGKEVLKTKTTNQFVFIQTTDENWYVIEYTANGIELFESTALEVEMESK